MNSHTASHRPSAARLGLGLLPWLAAAAVLIGLDGQLSQTTMALLLVLAAALASLWLPMRVSLLVGLIAVAAFNWRFVAPRGSMRVDRPEDALMLAVLLGLSWITAVLVGRLRRAASLAQRHSRWADQLRALAEQLRGAEPTAALPALVSPLRASLAALTDQPVKLWLAGATRPDEAEPAGPLAPDERAGLSLCHASGQGFGPGTGRHEELPGWYLPLRSQRGNHGAALFGLRLPADPDPELRNHVQALCDLLGQALERAATEADARRARDEAAAQATRNALLAAISHDYRTPLACILGAASSLLEQDARLGPEQRHRLAATIVDETEALSRLTDNSLQLARLDGPGVTLRTDWESAEEIVGTVLRRARQRRGLIGTDAAGEPRLRARLEPALPLLRCDALLLNQLLANLVDNALKYGGGSPVEILVRQGRREERDWIVLAVRDRGPGVPLAQRERVFEAFERGEHAGERRGAGVGLAACRAIARAHGGELRLRARGHGGCSFECWLPALPAPAEAMAP